MITKALAILLTTAVLLVQDASGPPGPTTATGTIDVRFGHADVYIDAGPEALAAYQCEIKATDRDVTLVGIEGGEHAAFNQPPYYDPKALSQQRIILGAFNTGADLPRGRTRVARLMVRIAGPTRPAYSGTVQVAASPDGKPIAATISVSEGAEQ